MERTVRLFARKLIPNRDTRGIFPLKIATGDPAEFAAWVDRVVQREFVLSLWRRDVKVLRRTLESWMLDLLSHDEVTTALLTVVDTKTVRRLPSRSLLIFRNLLASVGLFVVSGRVDEAYSTALEYEILRNPRREYVTEAVFRRAVAGNKVSAVALLRFLESSSVPAKVTSRLPGLAVFLDTHPRSISQAATGEAELLEDSIGGRITLLGPGRLANEKNLKIPGRQVFLIGSGNHPRNYPASAVFYMRRSTYTRLVNSDGSEDTAPWTRRVVCDEPPVATPGPQCVLPGLRSIGSCFNPFLGQLAAMDLLARGAGKVHIDGFDFYLSNISYRPGEERLSQVFPEVPPTWDGKQDAQGSSGRGPFERCCLLAQHSVAENISMVKFLVKNERVSVEPGLQKILDLDSSEIHSVLDSLYGRDRK